MISVCIATYNGERFIGEQLASILPQRGENDEIVISDDQSTDRTLELVAGFNDARIKVVHHQRYTRHSFPLDSTTHNFENALQHSRGDIIFLADQDDVWKPNKVKACINELRDCDFVICNCSVTDESLHVVIPSYFAFRHTNLSTLSNLGFCTWLGCCMAFHRSVLNSALPFPETQVAHDLWLGLVATSRFRCKMIYEPLSYYRRHQNTASPVSKRNSYSLWFKLKYRFFAIKEYIRSIVSK